MGVEARTSNIRWEFVRKNYDSRPINGGSDRYGLCEVCHKHMHTAFLGKFYTVYNDGRGGTINPWFSKFAHEQCVNDFGEEWVKIPFAC